VTHHVYVSASSLDSGEISRQGHTVALNAQAAVALEAKPELGAGTRVITPPDRPGETTTVIARTATYTTPKPRVLTAAEVEQELAKASPTDPATFLQVVATHGYPSYQPPAGEESARPACDSEAVGS
jgi:hypothetical protein